MANRLQQEMALKAVIRELLKLDFDVVGLCNNLACPMLSSKGDYDTRQAHVYLMDIVMNTVGVEKFRELQDNVSTGKKSIEEF